MATYYLDASVASVSGSGTGTLGDPFVKTDDLVNYAFTQVAAGPGNGGAGDVFIVLAGELTNTTEVDVRLLDGTSSTAGHISRPIWIKTTSPTTILDWNCGGTNFQYYPTQALKVAGFRFYNYSNSVANPTHYPFYTYRYGSFINCIFDSYAAQHFGLFNASIYTSVIGCKFINDNRYNGSSTNRGYLIISSTGVFKGNYIETTATAGTGYYSLNFNGTNVCGNIFYNTIDYTNGSHVPIGGARYWNNIFYNDSASPKRAIYNPSNYENANLIANNYFEGWSEAVHTSTGRLTLEYVVGNKGYNLINGYLFTPQFVENDTTLWDFDDPYFKNEMLPASALADPANKDFTPNALLLGSGFSLLKESPVNLGNKAENVGSILPNSATQRIRDLH